MALAAASAETGLGPSDPKEDAGDSDGAGLDPALVLGGGWGGGMDPEVVGGASGERLSLLVGLPDFVV